MAWNFRFVDDESRRMDSDPCPPAEVSNALGLRIERFVGGGHHQNWLCRRDGQPVALRRYVRPPIGDVGYEHRVAERLNASGWPVPILLDDPIIVDGSLWGLFRWLPGSHRADADTAPEQRDRGTLLAKLHETTSGLVDMGQRPGCIEAHDVVADPTLDDNLRAYAVWFPEDARLMAWHLDRARTRFLELDVSHASRVVLHGDFAPWNILFEGDRFSGLLDLETTHLNLLVADFALAWRGYADEVVVAYDRQRRLEELDWELLTPVWWSWLFLRVSDAITQMRQGLTEPATLRWTVGNLVKRSPLMRDLALPYTP